MDLADRVRRPFKLRSSDLNIGLLLFISTSLAILVRVLWAGVITSGFQDDVHVAASLARRYLQRPPGTEVVDMYTQGFLHPLLYVPLLALLRFIGIPPPLQDGFAIAFVQSVAVGLIALLAYAGSRALLNRGASVAVCFFCVGPPLLIRPVNLSITQLTPNGEILGSVLLLGMWTLLVHRPAGRRALSGVVALSVAAFHLKYQLVPQVWALILGGGLGRRRTFRLLAISCVACLVVDLLVYRLGGYGLFSRAGSLLGDYMGVVDLDASSREPSEFSLRAVAVWFIVKIFTFFANAPDRLMGLLATLAVEAPHFLLAWLVWLVPLCRAQRYPPHALHFFRASLLLSLATIAAILLPNKGMLNYYLLLIPTAVVVMATGLANVPGLVSPAASAKFPASWPARPFAMPWWAPLLALTPVLALLSVTGHRMTKELAGDGSRLDSLLPAETRQEGIHIFGLNSQLLGVHDTHISDLNLGTLLVLSWVKNDTTAYIRALTSSQDRPRFVLDHVSSPRKGAGLAPANYPPLEELARLHDVNLLEVYRVRQTNELGILYERIGDPQDKSIKGRE